MTPKIPRLCGRGLEVLEVATTLVGEYRLAQIVRNAKGVAGSSFLGHRSTMWEGALEI